MGVFTSCHCGGAFHSPSCGLCAACCASGCTTLDQHLAATPEPVEPSAALVERLEKVIREANLNRLDEYPIPGLSIYIARAVLPIIDDLIAERDRLRAQVANVETELHNAELRHHPMDPGSPAVVTRWLWDALNFTGDYRLDTRTDRTEERDEHEAARRAEEVRP